MPSAGQELNPVITLTTKKSHGEENKEGYIMRQNPNFPNWVTADAVLPMLVEQYCRVVIEGDPNDVHIVFIDPEAIGLVPVEDRETFKQIYSEYMDYMCKEIGMHNILSRFLFTVNTQESRVRLKQEIERALQLWEQRCGCSWKNVLLFKRLHHPLTVHFLVEISTPA